MDTRAFIEAVNVIEFLAGQSLNGIPSTLPITPTAKSHKTKKVIIEKDYSDF